LYTLKDVLTQCVNHKDHKFDYINNILVRKYIIASQMRYFGKESNKLEDASIIDVNDEYYIE